MDWLTYWLIVWLSCWFTLGGKVPEPPIESVGVLSHDPTKIDNIPPETQMISPPAIQLTSSPAYDRKLFTSSSEGQASLKEIWEMLDAEESFRSPTPRRSRSSSPPQPVVTRDLEPDHIPAHKSLERDLFALQGRQTEVQTRPVKQKPGLSKKATGKAKVTLKKLKVRNYNMRDDQGWSHDSLFASHSLRFTLFAVMSTLTSTGCSALGEQKEKWIPANHNTVMAYEW